MMSDVSQEAGPRPAADFLSNSSKSWLKRYALLSTGSESLLQLAKYELTISLLQSWPGGLGIALRRLFYPFCLKSMGKNVTIGRNVSLRGTRQIALGKDTFLDDMVCIDARGKEADIRLGDNVLVARSTIIRSRGKELWIGDGTNIGSFCMVGTNGRLILGKDILIGGYTYLCAGGAHLFEDTDTPILYQDCPSRGGITVGDGAWLGARVTVLDGASVGRGTVVGAHSLVNTDLPEMSICFGTPAKVIRPRD